MKKTISVFLSLCLAFSLLSASLSASAAEGQDSATIEQTVRALGIIVGDENGNMNLYSNVTRAEFAKMMVSASLFKDSVGTGTGSSLFRDVKRDHWAVEYIKLAVSKGWFVGYSDGNFYPDNTITLEEAATALLRLLDYTPSDIVGVYPYAQLSKFNALGLNEGLTRGEGAALSRYDCMKIFYNLMTAKNKAGAVYAKNLGYQINAVGKLDFSSLVSANMKGPFVLDAASALVSNLPFSSSNVSVYKNGSASSLSAAAAFDVYYYNASMRTVWLYDNKVVGTYTAASPSRVSPNTVTVAGNTYSVSTSAAAYKLSAMGSFSIGDTVTLLLGMDGTIVDVVAPGGNTGSETTSVTYYGVVTASLTSSYTDSSGNVVSGNNIKVACTDGVTRQFMGSVTVGSLVSAKYTGTKVTVSTLNEKSLNGTIDSAATKLDSVQFSSDIQIMDTNENGAYKVIYPVRLSGAVIKSSNVRYYQTDENGKLTVLILKDLTGDVYSYGILTSVTPGDFKVKASYEYLVSGKSGIVTSDTDFQVTGGPAILRYDSNGQIESIKKLNSKKIDSLTDIYAVNGGTQYRLSENVQVYQYKDSTYYLVNISTVSDLSKYTLTAYYDDFGYPAGNRVRVIIATEVTD